MISKLIDKRFKRVKFTIIYQYDSFHKNIMLLRLTEIDRSKLQDLAETADLSLQSAAIRSIRSGLQIESKRFNLSAVDIMDLAAEPCSATPEPTFDPEDSDSV